MKRILLSITATLMLGIVVHAQPAKRRTATTTTTTTRTAESTGMDRASLQFPTSASMPEDVVWKRDVYRQLDLMKDKNAPMYYPVEPVGRQVNLFTYLFRLVLTGRVDAYVYKLDGNESFAEKDKLTVKDMLDRYAIFYEEKDGKLNVADSDVPSAEATRYYLKESVFFDQRTGTFSTRVTALCPILMRGADDFSPEATPYPLFWLKYEDIAPWLTKLPMMGSNLNNVSNMTADDFFTLNRYEGKIYKTNNLQGRVLASYCPTDSAMAQEQQRIEQQLADFEAGIWGRMEAPEDSTKADSLPARARKATPAPTERKGLFSRSGVANRNRAVEVSPKEDKSASSAPRVSARRERR